MFSMSLFDVLHPFDLDPLLYSEDALDSEDVVSFDGDVHVPCIDAGHVADVHVDMFAHPYYWDPQCEW